MSYEVTFNNVSLSNYCKVLNVKRDILPERKNFSKDIPTLHGSLFTGFQYGERTITLEVGIVAENKLDYMNKVRELAAILNVATPSILSIDDEPDKYYYAIPTGTSNLDRLYKTATAEISFLCNDPFAYSKTMKVYSPDSKGIFTIDNDGSGESNPIIEVDFNNPACFFQATNPQGRTILVGQPKQASLSTVADSKYILQDECNNANNFLPLASNLVDSDDKLTGSLSVGINGSCITCSDYGEPQDGYWCGGALKRSLDENVEEFEVQVDVFFSSTGKNYVVPQPPPPTPSNPTPPAPNYGTYKVVNCGGLWINQDPNTSRPLYPMAPGTLIYPTEISNGWAKHTHSNKWNTFTGWSSMKYLQKVSDSRSTREAQPRGEYAEYQVGKLEIYGYDQNGAKLFKMLIMDNNSLYERVEPMLDIANDRILRDTSNCPEARKDGNGNMMASGVFGDWNDFKGNFIIRREKNANNQYVWSGSINKIENGTIVKSMRTQNSLINNNYPTGKLSYLGIFVSRLGHFEPMAIAGVERISVKKINMNTNNTNTNKEIFQKGDHLQIDNKKGLVTLNDKPFLNCVDIGSDFFSVPSGISQFMFKTDDNEASVCCGIQERYL